jgi:hypothetical protein
MYMLLQLNILGRDFIMWDKGALINYLNQGAKGTVTAKFNIFDDLISSLKLMKTEEK